MPQMKSRETSELKKKLLETTVLGKYLPTVGQKGRLSAGLQVLCSTYLCVTMQDFQEEVRTDLLM